MLHRVLPSIQLLRWPFDETWRNNWSLLDKNFYTMVDEALVVPGKKLGAALMSLMETKFAFSPDDYFDKDKEEDSQ